MSLTEAPRQREFPLFSRGTEYTDDSVMTVAVAEALMNAAGKSDDEIRAALVSSMRKWGKRYPDAGYGGRFYHWLRVKDPEPYGHGSRMNRKQDFLKIIVIIAATPATSGDRELIVHAL